MAILNETSIRPRYFDINGKPLSLGSVTYYFAGTTTLKNIFTDSTENTQATNPQVLDIGGYVREGGIWLGEGDYKVVLKDSNGNTLWTQDNVKGDTTANNTLTSVKNIQDMKDLPLEAGRFVFVGGYLSEKDNGGGYFYYDELSTDTDDAGYVINSTGAPASGRYLRINNSNKVLGSEFGISNENTGTINGNLTNAQSYVTTSTTRKTLILDTGGKLSGNFTTTGDYRLEILEGVKFTADSAFTIKIDNTNAICESRTSLVDDTALLDWSPSNDYDCYPEWWGVNDAAFSDDRVPLGNITTTTRIVFTGAYSLAPFAAPALVTLDGCHFKTGCTINAPAGLAVNTEFFNVTWDKDASGIFTGGQYDRLRFNQPVDINLFDSALTNGTYYENVLKGITAAKTKTGQLIWTSLTSNKKIQPGITFTDKSYIISSKIIDCEFDLVNDLYIGNVVNGSERIINETSSKFPIITNPNYKLAWLGVSEADDATSVEINYQALARFDAWTETLGDTHDIYPIWDGENMTVKTAKTLSMNGQSGPILKVKNLLIKESANVALTLTGNRIISMNMNIEFDNVSFDTDAKELYFSSLTGRNFTWNNSTFKTGANNSVAPVYIGTTAGDVKLDNISTTIALSTNGFVIGATGEVPYSITVRNCNFDCQNTALMVNSTYLSEVTNCTIDNGYLENDSTNTGHTIIRDCQILGQAGNEGIQFNNSPSCEIINCLVENDAVIEIANPINDKGQIIQGNRFLKTLRFNDTDAGNMVNISVQGNHLYDQIRFAGNGSTIANGILVTNNKFYAGLSDNPTTGSYWIEAISFNPLLHVNCMVKDNIAWRSDGSLVSNVPGTESSLNIADASTINGRNDYTCTDTAIGVIFPQLAYPLYGYVSEDELVGDGVQCITRPPFFFSSTGNSGATGTGRVGITCDSVRSVSFEVRCIWNRYDGLTNISQA